MRRHEVLAAGVLSGTAGGVAMAAVAMIGATSQGFAAAHPLQVIGESFVGPEALSGVAGAKVAFGALVHLATSVGFGMLFASILPRDFEWASAVGVGVGLALFTLMFMMTFVVPWANPDFVSGMQDIGGTWVIAHAVYGAALGMAPALRRWFAREATGGFVPQARLRPQAGPLARPSRTS